jgi:DNA modification methylase
MADSQADMVFTDPPYNVDYANSDKDKMRGMDRPISIVGPANRNNGADVFGSRVDCIHRCRGCRRQDPCTIDIGFQRRIRHIQWLSFDLQ